MVQPGSREQSLSIHAGTFGLPHGLFLLQELFDILPGRWILCLFSPLPDPCRLTPVSSISRVEPPIVLVENTYGIRFTMRVIMEVVSGVIIPTSNISLYPVRVW